MSDYLSVFKRIPEEDRRGESSRIRAKYPDRCCVIVTKAANSDAPELGRHKYLVPGDISMGQFTYVIRKRIKVRPEKAIFLFETTKRHRVEMRGSRPTFIPDWAN